MNNKNFSNVTIIEDSIKVEIKEGKKQLRNYWVAEVKGDAFGGYEIIGFVNAKGYDYTKIFKLEQDKYYVIQFGKGTSKDTTRRNFISIVDGVATIIDNPFESEKSKRLN